MNVLNGNEANKTNNDFFAEKSFDGSTVTALGNDSSDELLTPEEEYEVASRAMQGDKAARDKMACANQRLVSMVAFRYVKMCRNLDFDDLKQAGNLGLLQAIRLFDPNKGYRFSTYAIWWIRQAITREIADKDRTIRLPIHVNEQLSRLRRVAAEIEQKTGRKATNEELAAEMGEPLEKIEDLASLAFVTPTVSIDKPIGEDGDSTLGDFLLDDGESPQDVSDAEQLRSQMMQAIALLSPREQAVIKLRYGMTDGRPHTLEEVGAAYNVTRERVRQIEAKALRKLRGPKISALIKDFRG